MPSMVSFYCQSKNDGIAVNLTAKTTTTINQNVIIFLLNLFAFFIVSHISTAKHGKTKDEEKHFYLK